MSISLNDRIRLTAVGRNSCIAEFLELIVEKTNWMPWVRDEDQPGIESLTYDIILFGLGHYKNLYEIFSVLNQVYQMDGLVEKYEAEMSKDLCDSWIQELFGNPGDNPMISESTSWSCTCQG